MTATELKSIPLAELHESKLNPRRHFNPAALEELRASLVASGQITPITVRPSGNGTGGYEILAGHRRFRAAVLAGLPTLDAVVREVDDSIALEILTIENLQRDDLHPLEEAQGFAALMKNNGYDVPKIAARVGRSIQYVYDRVKLLQLTKEAKELFLADKFTAGHAILLARLSKDDQERAIGANDGRWGRVEGLFTVDYADDELPLQGNEDEKRKAVSVREFQTWINDNVRFIPDREDLPNLFPETAAALAAAKEEELKVVKITRDYRVPDEAKDPKERTYGEASWKRADGETEPSRFGRSSPGKTCDFAVMGIVVAGPGRGEAFKVCVNKDKCKVHWAKEQKEKAQRSTTGNGRGNTSADEARRQEQYRRQQEQQAAEQARYKKAIPALAEALIQKLATAPAGLDSPIGKRLLERHRRGVRGAKTFQPDGKGAEDLVRLLAWYELADDALSEWRGPRSAAQLLKPLGIDVAKIVDQANPKPAVQTSGKPAKKLAGDVRRAKKKAHAA